MTRHLKKLISAICLAGFLTHGASALSEEYRESMSESYKQEAMKNRPSKQETIDFLKRHFERYSSARLLYPKEEFRGNSNNAGPTSSTIGYDEKTNLMTVFWEFSSDPYNPNLKPPMYGGQFRFDPTMLSDASCQEWYNQPKIYGLNLKSYGNGNQINVVVGNSYVPTGSRVEYAHVAFFRDLDQCERAVKAFKNLVYFRSDDPF